MVENLVLYVYPEFLKKNYTQTCGEAEIYRVPFKRKCYHYLHSPQNTFSEHMVAVKNVVQFSELSIRTSLEEYLIPVSYFMATGSHQSQFSICKVGINGMFFARAKNIG